jgi:hypothetical protein
MQLYLGWSLICPELSFGCWFGFAAVGWLKLISIEFLWHTPAVCYVEGLGLRAWTKANHLFRVRVNWCFWAACWGLILSDNDGYNLAA